MGKMCKVCGKEGHFTDIMRHIEANHLDGVYIPCNHCDKFFRSRNGFNISKTTVKVLFYHFRTRKGLGIHNKLVPNVLV